MVKFCPKGVPETEKNGELKICEGCTYADYAQKYLKNGKKCVSQFYKISKDYGNYPGKALPIEEWLKKFIQEEIHRLGNIKNNYVAIMAQTEDNCFYAETFDLDTEVMEEMLESMTEDGYNNNEYWIFFNGKELKWEEKTQIIIEKPTLTVEERK